MNIQKEIDNAISVVSKNLRVSDVKKKMRKCKSCGYPVNVVDKYVLCKRCGYSEVFN